MFNLISSLLAVFSFVLAREIFDFDRDRETIEKCVPGVNFIRRRTKVNYTAYQFMTDGKIIDPIKLTGLIQDYTGKHVKVFFNRVLTVRIYRKGIPKTVKFPVTGDKSLNVQVGVGLGGTVTHDFRKYPHLIVAGSTGYGKTNFLKGLIHQLDGEIVLLDLKGSNDFSDVTAKNIDEAYTELSKISQALRKGRSKRIFVVVDEAAELLAPSYMSRKEAKKYVYCQSVISEIARLGRSLGVSLIYCTQYPTADVLPRQVKQNCESRIVFRLPTEVASRVALDENGAEKIETGMWGRAIYKTDDIQNIQTYLYEGKGEGLDVKVRDQKAQRAKDHITIG